MPAPPAAQHKPLPDPAQNLPANATAAQRSAARIAAWKPSKVKAQRESARQDRCAAWRS